MKEEHSAGGVIVKKYQGKWNVLLLKDKNSNWTFPKGLIESNEDVQEAAQREISEETGVINLEYKLPVSDISYWYIRDGINIHKTVQYFLYQSHTEQTLVPQVEEGISEVQWIPLDSAITVIGYPKTNKQLLEITKKLLRQF